MTINIAYYFKIAIVLDLVLTAFSTVNNVSMRELNFGNSSSACAKKC